VWWVVARPGDPWARPGPFQNSVLLAPNHSTHSVGQLGLEYRSNLFNDILKMCAKARGRIFLRHETHDPRDFSVGASTGIHIHVQSFYGYQVTHAFIFSDICCHVHFRFALDGLIFAFPRTFGFWEERFGSALRCNMWAPKQRTSRTVRTIKNMINLRVLLVRFRIRVAHNMPFSSVRIKYNSPLVTLHPK
jgi:hypothetical protein